MTIKKLSPKQAKLLFWCHGGKYDNIIADGAVRSGKTTVMAISFIHYCMRYHNGKNFAICGKTVKTAIRNIIIPLLSSADITNYFTVTFNKTDGLIKVKGKDTENTFYIFGGKDEGSFALIQGITLSGVLFDEVALMPKSFVEQAIARTLAEKGAKLWFNCNPENPSHWFYKEWIKDADGENRKNSLHLHFLMSDNPTLTDAQLKKAEKLYSGVFYDRFIKGLWVRAEGRIYSDISGSLMPEKDVNPKDFERINIGIDFGGNRSRTTFVCSGLHKNFSGLTVLKDYAVKGKKGEIDIERIGAELYRFILSIKESYGAYPNIIFADSAEQYLINSLNKYLLSKNVNIPVKDSEKGKIIDRIRCTEALIKTKKLKIVNSCNILTEGLKNAVWDEEAALKGLDIRLDDFTSDIDILDAFEYSFSAYLKYLTPHILELKNDSYNDFNGVWE